MINFVPAKKQFPAATALLSQKVAALAVRTPVVNVADNVRAVYHAVSSEAIALTEGEARHYGSVIAALMDRVNAARAEISAKRQELRKKNVPSTEWPVFKISDVLSPGEVEELNAASQLLVRAVLPLVGFTAFDYAEDFGDVGAAFAAAYRETVLAVTQYDPRPHDKGRASDPNNEQKGKRISAMKLTAFIEERLELRMKAQLQDDEGNRKQQERAALMLKYLAALELDPYVAHDPAAVLEGIAYLHGGRYLTHRIVDGKKLPIELREGEQYPLNPAFVEQHFNTVAKVERALEDVYHTRFLSLDYSVNQDLGTLADTLASKPDELDEIDMLEDMNNRVYRLSKMGYDEDFMERLQPRLHALITGAIEADKNLGRQIPALAEDAGLTEQQALDMIKVWVPFFLKYQEVDTKN